MTGTATAHTGGAPSSFVVVWANMKYGGVDPATGNNASWRQTIRAIARLQPDVVCLQEIDHRPAHVWKHVHRTANALNMQPVLGPSAATRTETGNHVGILVRVRTEVQIVDQWPPPGVAGSKVPWCKATLLIDGIGELMHVYSVHLPARSTSAQLEHVEHITNLATVNGELALVAGDFNGYPAQPEVPPEELALLPPHLQLTRCRETPAGLAPDLRVWDMLTRARLLDVAAELPTDARDPRELIATGRGRARVDRCHAAQRLAKTATRYRQVKTGSDHDAGVLWFDLQSLAPA